MKLIRFIGGAMNNSVNLTGKPSKPLWMRRIQISISESDNITMTAISNFRRARCAGIRQIIEFYQNGLKLRRESRKCFELEEIKRIQK
jgi:hypothetical protein